MAEGDWEKRAPSLENRTMSFPTESVRSDEAKTPSIHSDHSRYDSGPEDPEKANRPRMSRMLSHHQLSRQATSIKTNATTDPVFEIDWEGDDDPKNPRNWSSWYRCVIIGLTSFSTWVVYAEEPTGNTPSTLLRGTSWLTSLPYSVVYSTTYASGLQQMMKEFHVQSEPVATLGITTYLAGLGAGAVVSAPLSEVYGRRPVYIISMFIFMLFVLPCALSKQLVEVLVWRFLGGLVGSVMIANAPGTVSDIVDDDHRALAFSLWSIGPMLGPIWGPVIGGFVTQYLGWRWTNWLVLIFAGVAMIAVVLIRETYAPAILRQKAKRRRHETEDPRWWSRYDERLGLWPLLKVNLSRPFVMTFTEPICQFWCLYISVVYGILYLCFVAYPIVFSEIRGWTPGMSGLAFLGIGVGSLLAIMSEPLVRRMINAHAVDPETGKAPPEAMISVVCIAAILTPIGELWFAWTCVPKNLHWAWCLAAGIPFGAGNTFTFIYGTNYLAHSYGIYAASALAGNAVVRSLVGGALPLAGSAMYRTLTPHWAGTLLGLLEVCLIPIPFVFYKYGHRIRMKSRLISQMQKDKQRLAGKRAAAAAARGAQRGE